MKNGVDRVSSKLQIIEYTCTCLGRKIQERKDKLEVRNLMIDH
jgi:hypothetical protein